MNLLFDLTATQPSPFVKNVKFHGGGLYGEVIFFALLKRTKDFIGIYDSKLYINPEILESGIKLYDVNNISPAKLVEKENIDVFYTPLYNYKNEWQVSVKRYVITWHGTRELALPIECMALYYKKSIKTIIKIIMKIIMKNYYLKRKKFHFDVLANVKNAEYLTVSEHSKYDIINLYPHLAKKISVFYSPLNDEQIEIPQSKLDPQSYFLLTSSARWEKNNLRAVWAFDELFSQRQDLDFKVVLTGVTNEKIYTRKLKNRDKFIFFNYVDRAELLSLHKNAYAFIYPSLNEGFGYPPIESMRYGVPVAASGTSAIPEICQNAAIYFDPRNTSEIKNRILQLLDKNIYAEYSARAVERYKIVSERQKQDLEKIVNFILGEKYI